MSQTLQDNLIFKPQLVNSLTNNAINNTWISDCYGIEGYKIGDILNFRGDDPSQIITLQLLKSVIENNLSAALERVKGNNLEEINHE